MDAVDHKGLSDNKASVPKWFRDFVVFIHGVKVMDKIDEIGSRHDERLRAEMIRHKANRLMSGEMASELIIPAYITLFLWFSIWVYAILPEWIRDLYWSLV